MTGFKQTAHSPDCYLAADGRTEYIVPARPYYMRNADKNGKVYKDQRGSTWIAFACNDADCTSEIWVRWDVLMRWLAAGVTPDADDEFGQEAGEC